MTESTELKDKGMVVNCKHIRRDAYTTDQLA